MASVQEDLGTNEYPQFVAALAGLATSGEDERVWRDLVNACQPPSTLPMPPDVRSFAGKLSVEARPVRGPI